MDSFDLNCAVNFFRQFQQVLKHVGLLLYAVTVTGSALDRWITFKMESILTSAEGISPWIWLYGLFSLTINLIFPLAAVLLILSVLSKSRPLDFLEKNLEHGLIETMRAWGSAMLWSLLFLVPGLIRWTQYLLIPFIVCLDPAYGRGEVDALKRARQMSKGRMMALFGLFFIFSLVLPVFMTGFDEWKLIWETPLAALFICFVEMLFNICFILSLSIPFQRSLSNELAVSMERHPEPRPRTDI